MIEKRIPKEEATAMMTWRVPVLGVSGTVLPSHEKQVKDGKNESIQNLSAYVQNGRLTGDVLEKLHQQIVEEGMAKGQAEGYKIGYEQGLQKGQANGYQIGYQEGKIKADAEAKQLQNLFDQLFEPFQNEQERVEKWILQSVKDILLALMQRECQLDEMIVMTLIKESVENLSAGSKKISVKLHPDDLALVTTFVQQKSLNWNVISDVDLRRGDCYVSSDDANVDFSLSARVDQALLAMTDAIKNDACIGQ